MTIPGFVATGFQVRDGSGRLYREYQVSSKQKGSVLVVQSQLYKGACFLSQIAGYNAAATKRYIHLFDTSASAVSAGEVPAFVIPVAGAGDGEDEEVVENTFSLANSWMFANGLVIGSSTTQASFTPASSRDLFYGAKVLVAS